MDGASARTTSRGVVNATRRVDETGPVQRSAAVGGGRSDIHGFGVNALAGSFPVLKYARDSCTCGGLLQIPLAATVSW
jgi:hypothetical protein